MARLSGRWGASIVLQPRMVGRGEGEYFSSLLKARRDLGVHNDWLVNAVYLRKVKEARLEQAPLPGTRLIPDFQYLTQSIELCDTLVGAIANLLGEKWIPIATEIKRLNPGQDGDLQPGAA